MQPPSIMLDTNVLVPYSVPTLPLFGVVETAIKTLRGAGHQLCVVLQNFYEFWNVATRPLTSNGLGLTIAQAQVELKRIRRLFRILPDPSTLLDDWESLVVAYQCHGKVSFDARIVAAMNAHNVTRILTFNGKDFARYPGLTVIDPAAVVPVP